MSGNFIDSIPGRIIDGIMNPIVLFKEIPMFYNPNIEITGGSSRELGVKFFASDDLDNWIIDRMIPGYQGLIKGQFSLAMFVEVILMNQDMVVYDIILTGAAEIQIPVPGELLKTGLLIEEPFFIPDYRLPELFGGHGRGYGDFTGKARYLRVDILDPLGTHHRNPVIAIPDKIDPPNLIELNRGQDNIPQPGFINPFPPLPETIRSRQEVFGKIPVPALAAHDQFDRDRLHTPVGFAFRLKNILYFMEG
jgi:hypothetical protein